MPWPKGTHGAGKGPAGGAGWGGPATGNSGDRPATPFSADSETRQTIPGGVGDPDKAAARAARQAELEARADWYLDFYHSVVANEVEPTPNRIAAADKALDRIVGKAVARQEHSGPGGGEIVTRIERVIVDPANTDGAGIPAAIATEEV